MSEIAIKVEDLGKSYLLGHNAREEGYTALRDVLARNARNLARKTRDMLSGKPIIQGDEVEEFWALRDLSFVISRGESVGIIGRNGAGKSTLLKLLSRITEPTHGSIRIHGRVASLLEVGTGFHPELSGRENIYLNGAILGMSRREVRRKFDDIVAFAEVEKFLDTPVKRYSSGMYVRLAFAVAAHLEPEILVVDEVLAVGDAAFQKKCLGKMGEVAHEGRTVLFVSHNMAAVQTLCSKGIVLRSGRLQFHGSQQEAVAAYLSTQVVTGNSLDEHPNRRGSGEVQVRAVSFVDGHGTPIDTAVSGQTLGIRLHFQRHGGQTYPRLIAGIAAKTTLDSPVFLQHNRLTGQVFGDLPEQGFIELRIPRLPLPPGSYRLDYSLLQDGSYLDAITDAAELTVTDGDFFGSGEVPPASHGVCLVAGDWLMQPVH